MPAPPCSGSIGPGRKPSSPIRLTRCMGNSPFSSAIRAAGATSCSANSRACAWMRFCAGVNSKSMCASLSLSICIQHGETFYFDQRLILEKARDLKKGFGGIIIAEEGAMYLAQGFKVCKIIIPVAHKDSDFRNILHLAACGFDNALQVAKCLFKLGYQVSGGDNLTFSIATGLPGEEEEMALRYKDTMTEAPGMCQSWWIDDSFFHGIPPFQRPLPFLSPC